MFDSKKYREIFSHGIFEIWNKSTKDIYNKTTFIVRKERNTVMSTFLISDVHGHYSEFEKMLKKIKFTDKDTMYILGDIIDRGTENVKMIEFVMTHENVHMILGNHEDFLLKAYTATDAIERKYAEALWMYNGGGTTKRELETLPEDTRTKYVEFLKSLPRYLFIQNGSVLLVHAGIFLKKNKTVEELMKEQEENCIWKISSILQLMHHSQLFSDILPLLHCQDTVTTYQMMQSTMLIMHIL